MSYVSTKIDEDIRAALKEVGNYIVSVFRQKAPKDTGRLRNSIGYSITETRDGYQLRLGYLIYGVFQDLGVNGTRVNQGSPFQFRSQTVGGSLPFAVRKSIAEKGLRAKNWSTLTPAEQEQADLKIQDLFGMDLDELFSNILTKTNVVTA
jgi:hypothetical protein